MDLPPSGAATRPQASRLADLVGQTPLLPLQRVISELSPRVHLFVKAEWFNPGGSVKDRPAAAILEEALSRGAFEGGKALLDSTSGNMGIAYASLGAALGLRVCLAIPANVSRERLQILQAFGAQVILTDPTEGSEGARVVAAQMAQDQPEAYAYLDQYSNAANWQSHYRTTGPEVMAQTGGRITHFVAGLGTTGTMTGTGRYLREHAPWVRRVAVQPDGPMHGLEGLKHLPTTQVPAIYDPTIPDETQIVQTEAAYAMARRLAREEGLLVGVSSAAAAVAALAVARSLEEGTIVILFPDSGLKYLGAEFWTKA
jgi:cysteine synthase B